MLVEFIVPEGYKRLSFDRDVVDTNVGGARPDATWAEIDDLKDGRISLYAIAYPLVAGSLGTTGYIRVSNVTAVKE